MEVVSSKNAFLFNLDIEEAVLFGEAFEEFAQIIGGPSYLAADLEEEALLVVDAEYLLADVLEQHEDGEVALDAKANWGRGYMLKLLEEGSSSSTPYSTTSA
jgi:hypothetical protein